MVLTVNDSARKLGPEFAEALAYTYELHAGQRRKGDDGVPYIGHLLVVAGTVIDGGGSEDEAIAALLHDAAEDQGGEEQLAEIERRFGRAVALNVRENSDSTDEVKGPWRERKQAYIDSISEKSAPALTVSIADKLHNARAIVRDHRAHGDALWERFTAKRDDVKWYYRELATAFRKRAKRLDRSFPDLDEFEEAIEILNSL